MARNDDADPNGALAFHSGQITGMLETCDSRSLDRDTLEYVARQFNQSLDNYRVDSDVIHVDPETEGN